MSAGATATISDDENGDEPFFVVLDILGKKHRHGVQVPKNDLTFKRIRQKIIEDEIPAPAPFRFTLGAGGTHLSAEQEENWSDWSLFKRKGGGERYFETEYHVFIEEGNTEDKPLLVMISVLGKDKGGGVVQVPKNDLSFKRIRDEINEDEIPVQKPFQFTLGAGGKPLSAEQEEHWSDWSVFKREGARDFENEYHVFIEEICCHGQKEHIN